MAGIGGAFVGNWIYDSVFRGRSVHAGEIWGGDSTDPSVGAEPDISYEDAGSGDYGDAGGGDFGGGDFGGDFGGGDFGGGDFGGDF
jgi:hypothetical protein